MLAKIKHAIFTALTLYAAGQFAFGGDIHIVVGQTIDEQSNLAIGQLSKCGTTAESTNSSDGKGSVSRITRMYYSRGARVFIEVVTQDGKVERLMWQSYDSGSDGVTSKDFTSASEVHIQSDQFRAVGVNHATKTK